MFVLVKFVVTLIVIVTVTDGIELFDTSENVCMEDITTCEDIASPYHIQIIQLVNSTVITWSLPQISGECTVEFELSLYVNDELLKSDTTKANYYILNEELATCSKFRVEIRTVTDRGSKSALTIAEIYTAFVEITSITVNNGIASWSIKEKSTRCMFRVEVNGEIVADNLNELSYNVGCLIPCETHEITVTPVNADGALGTPHTIDYEPGIPSPYNIQIIQIDTSVVITWARLQITKNCTTEYEISFYINDVFLMTATTELTQYIFEEGLASCSRLRIEIRAISSSGFESDLVSAEIDTGIQSPRNIQMIQNDCNVVVTWDRPQMTENCSIVYEISFYINDVSVMSDTTELTHYIFNEGLESCSRLRTELRAVSSNGFKSDLISAEMDTEMDKISNVTIENDVISWSMANGPTRCKFRIQLNNEIVKDNLNDVSYRLENLRACIINEITVTPVNFNGNIGISHSLKHEPVPVVQNFKLVEENVKLLASWDHLSEYCTIVLVIGKQKYTVQDSPDGLLVVDARSFTYCVSYLVTVMYVSVSGKTGEETAVAFSRVPNAVENFYVTQEPNSDVIKASWNVLNGECTIMISILDTNNKMIVSANEGLLILNDDHFKHCTTYTIQAEIVSPTGYTGNVVVSYAFERRPPAMQNFHVTEDIEIGEITIKWDPLVGNCITSITISDRIIHEKSDVGYLHLTTDNFNHCTAYNLYAQFMSTSGVGGDVEVVTFERLPPEVANFNVVEDPDAGTIRATWKALTGECTIAITIPAINYRISSSADIGFLDLDQAYFSYCTTYTFEIEIVSSTDDATSVVILYEFERMTPAMQNFHIIEDSGAGVIAAVWNRLSGSCVTSITISNTVIRTNASTGFRLLDRDYFDYCMIYEIQAQFISPTGVGGSFDSFAFERYPPIMTEFQISEISGAIVAKWASSDFNCPVVITIFDKVIATVLSESSVTLEDENFDYCSEYKLAAQYVTTANANIWGRASNLEFERNPPAMSNLLVSENTVSGVITASWPSSEFDCAVKITISDTVIATVSAGNSVAFDENFEYCRGYPVAAQYVANTDDNLWGSASNFEFERNPPAMSDFHIHENTVSGVITASWPSSEYDCPVKISISDRVIATVPSGNTASLEYCLDYCNEHQVAAQYVATTNENIWGSASNFEFERNPPAMSDFHISENTISGEIIASWSGSEFNCAVTITMYDAVIAIVTSGNSVVLEKDFEYCSGHQVAAQYVATSDDTIWGSASNFEFERNPPAMSDFHITEDTISGIITASWPSSEFDCAVKIAISDTVIASVSAGNSVAFDENFEYCRGYQVAAQYVATTNENIWGSASNFEFERNPPAMSDFYVSENTVSGVITASWPSSKFDCAVKISISDRVIAIVTSGNSIVLEEDFQYCSGYQVVAQYVATTNENIWGSPSNFEFERNPPAMSGFFLSENINSGVITASWSSSEFGCPVKISISNVVIAMVTSGSSVSLEKVLEYCKEHQVAAQYVAITDGNIWGSASNLAFERNPPAMSDFHVSENVSSGVITASWPRSDHNCAVAISISGSVIAIEHNEDWVDLDYDFDYCSQYKVAAQHIATSDDNIWGSASYFIFERPFQPIKGMSISIKNQIAEASLLLIDDEDMRQCIFDGIFNFDCTSLDRGQRTTGGLTHTFSNCPLNAGVTKFTIGIAPYLGTNEFKVRRVYCQYEVIRHRSKIFLQKTADSDNVCPEKNTL